MQLNFQAKSMVNPLNPGTPLRSVSLQVYKSLVRTVLSVVKGPPPEKGSPLRQL